MFLFLLLMYVCGLIFFNTLELRSFTAVGSSFQERKDKISNRPKFRVVPEDVVAEDIGRLITIASSADVVARRRQLISFIWGENTLPFDDMPTDVLTVREKFFQKYVKSFERCDKLVIPMEQGMISNCFLFFPKKSNRKFILFHQGHSESIDTLINGMNQYLSRGYTVGLIFMPTMSPNSKPMMDSKEFGPFLVSNHELVDFLEVKKGRPIKFFLHPVVVTLNYVIKQYGFKYCAMAGLSGGGWTTVFAAALDPRIVDSFPVAGANPFFLNTGEGSGDYETMLPELFALADYSDLFVLGAVGPGRKQLRIYNKYDSCCFFGEKSALLQNHLDETLLKINDGGQSLLFIDDSALVHMMTLRSIEKMLAVSESRTTHE